jgi:hypothetical protein
MEPSFIEYLIKQSLMRPDRMIEALLLLTAVLVLVLLVAFFRRPDRSERPVLQMPQAPFLDASPSVRPDLFSKSIPSRSERVISNKDVAELLDIEEALLALRELYQRHLISAQVYVDESTKHSARLMR